MKVNIERCSINKSRGCFHKDGVPSLLELVLEQRTSSAHFREAHTVVVHASPVPLGEQKISVTRTVSLEISVGTEFILGAGRGHCTAHETRKVTVTDIHSNSCECLVICNRHSRKGSLQSIEVQRNCSLLRHSFT